MEEEEEADLEAMIAKEEPVFAPQDDATTAAIQLPAATELPSTAQPPIPTLAKVHSGSEAVVSKWFSKWGAEIN